MSEKEDRLTRKEQILLTEYKKSQDSAEHFSTLAWTVISIFLAGSFLLITKVSNMSKCIAIYSSILSLASTIVVWYFVMDFRGLMKIKYERCKEIEKYFKILDQHTRTKYYKRIPQKYFIAVLMLLLILFWVCLLITKLVGYDFLYISSFC